MGNNSLEGDGLNFTSLLTLLLVSRFELRSILLGVYFVRSPFANRSIRGVKTLEYLLYDYVNDFIAKKWVHLPVSHRVHFK